ncbi:DUF3303 family protein [Streptomyces sp. NBC_01262]|jgi:hypothetical protein|uniref:DUF3303 family protein n=1 Tax=Streptomyces sp. NBC_01262 TaxID=2903803 RepID=UPI002E37C9FB|nr:DUF3303 family protein [Streptomyces sp. NBC_01262]
MRMLLTARFNTEAANQLVTEGTLSKVIEGILEHLKPESSYFTAMEGERTCFIVFDMTESSQLPTICEPFFQVGAKVAVRPVMNAEDLRTGLSQYPG